ncbi:MAG: hypothetical protein R3E32_00760 [Chitinophagales bacterium]
MFKKFLLGLFIYLFAATTIFAQAPTQVQSIDKYNEMIDKGISENELQSHTLRLNAGGQTWTGILNYTENIYFYFEAKAGIVALKKISISTKVAERMGWKDFLFDDTGNVVKHFNITDATKASSPSVQYYFLSSKLVTIIDPNGTRNPNNFETEDIQKAVEVLNEAKDYKKVFDSIIAIQLGAK